MKTRIKAIILAKQKYREYDELVWIYTEQHGVLSAIIYGIKRKRSKYQGELALFSLVYVEIKVRTGLSTIYNFDLIDKHVTADSLFLSYTYGAGLSELTRRVLSDVQPIYGMFDLLVRLFTLIPRLKQPELVLVYFKQKLLPYTGSQVGLVHCVCCSESTHIIGYSHRLHGLVCGRCQHMLVENDIRDTEKIKVLVAFFRLTIDKLAELVMPEADLAFLVLFWDELYGNNLGMSLKSQKVLKSMKETKEGMQW